MERAGEESAAPLGSGSFERQDALARPDVERDRVTDITAISRCIAFGGIVGWTHRSRSSHPREQFDEGRLERLKEDVPVSRVSVREWSGPSPD
jgi:hypothetical protein